MNAEHRIHAWGVEHAVCDHGLGPAGDLLGRLERHFQRAGERDARQPSRYLEADGDMPVVSAGVHLPGVFGAVRHVVRLLDRERVHVGPDQHAAARAPCPQGNDTGLTDTGPHVVAERPHALRDERAGARFLEADLGVLVEIAAGGDELGAVDGGEIHIRR